MLYLSQSRVVAGLISFALTAAFSGCNSGDANSPYCLGSPCNTTSVGGIEYPLPAALGGEAECVNNICIDSTDSLENPPGSNFDTDALNYSNGYTTGYDQGLYNGVNQEAGNVSGGVYALGYNAGYDNATNTTVVVDSHAQTTKDTDLEQATVQQKSLQSRAEVVANQFQMSVSAATQLVELSDRVRAMVATGQMTDEDQIAVSTAALGIAGVTSDQVQDAIQKVNQGDSSAADALLQKAAQNLGMSSAASLRDSLLPALGVKVN